MLIGSQLQGWAEEYMLGCVKSPSAARWKSPNLGQAREIFPFSDVVSGHRRSRFCSTRRGRQKPPPDPSNFAPQISQPGCPRPARVARSPLFCGDDLIELLLLPSFLTLRGVGLVSNLSAFPHRAPLSLKSREANDATAFPF